MFILQVCETLSSNNINYALIGGYAVALHGAVRGTVDIDFVIQWELDQLIGVENAMNSIGLVSKLPINAKELYENRDEFIENRNMIAWNFYDPEDLSKSVDLVINYDLGDREVVKKSVGLSKVCLLNKTDLIDMKTKSARPQDLEDVKSLKSL
ncbi:hypothetical protein [Marinicella meishanensis]|uniref:hypothetical protein n=1 Tax=Marinicella meishanensis TaxID=2873263 RepID=UPI001CC15B96|nr:hypothetical protein [Marinicella sp. NBU2979]